MGGVACFGDEVPGVWCCESFSFVVGSTMRKYGILNSPTGPPPAAGVRDGRSSNGMLVACERGTSVVSPPAAGGGAT